MSKGKKIYCMASFMLSIVALTICLVFCARGQVYASSRDNIDNFDSAVTAEESTPDYNDGLWIPQESRMRHSRIIMTECG